MELRVGNKYRLGRKIGSGSFGDIYLGECFWLQLSGSGAPGTAASFDDSHPGSLRSHPRLSAALLRTHRLSGDSSEQR